MRLEHLHSFVEDAVGLLFVLYPLLLLCLVFIDNTLFINQIDFEIAELSLQRYTLALMLLNFGLHGLHILTFLSQ